MSAPANVMRPEPSLDPPDDGIIKRESRTWVWRETPGPDGPTVVKLYRKRGALWLLRSMVARFRAEREFRRLAHLARAGVPCTVPVSWRWGYSSRHGFHEVLVTHEIRDAIEVGAFVRGGGDPASLAPMFAVVRRMHEAGLCHQALCARNVLMCPTDPGEPHFYIADVPRSWTFPTSIVGRSMARLDVRDLVLSLIEEGASPLEVPVEAYGFDALLPGWDSGPGRLRIVADTARRCTKRMRLRRDAHTRLCWIAAWAVRGRIP